MYQATFGLCNMDEAICLFKRLSVSHLLCPLLCPLLSRPGTAVAPALACIQSCCYRDQYMAEPLTNWVDRVAAKD